MKLRGARLCLDCEEIHDAQQCPVCASETFAFLSRWVPAPEKDARVDARPRVAPPASKKQIVGYGVLGVGLVALTQWVLKGRRRIEEAAARKPTGELK